MNRAATIERTKVKGNLRVADHDFLAIEEPLELRLNGEALSVTMRTPGDDLDLARGFLLTEQIIKNIEDIKNINCHDNIVEVQVPPEILKDKCWLRNFYASSSCGVCGKASIEQLKITRPIVESSFQIARLDFIEIPGRMRSAQSAFEQTGGLHAAVLFNRSGEIVCVREDVGRHNAVDKVIGWMMNSRLNTFSDTGLFVSGRTSFEILQKAIAAGIPLVGAVSAPSSLAVRLAKEYHVTLAGFVRGDSFNLYYDNGRITN